MIANSKVLFRFYASTRRAQAILTGTRLLLLVLCLPGASSAQPIKIGVITELTGQSATAVKDCRQGLELAQSVSENRTFPIELIYADSQESPTAALSEFQKLVAADQVYALLSTRSKIAIPLAPLAEQKKIPLLATSAHPALTTRSSYTVRVYPSAEVEGPFLATQVIAAGSKNVAVMTAEDEWNIALSTAFEQSFRKLGGTIVLSETIPTNTREFATLASKVKATAADAVFVNLILSQAGGLAKKLHDQRVDLQLVSNFWIQMPETKAQAGKAALEGVIFSEIDFDHPRARTAYEKQFPGASYNSAAHYCYVMLATALQPLQRVATRPSHSEYAQALLEQSSVTLLDAKLSIINREVQFTLVAKQLQDEQAITLPNRSSDE